MSSSSDFIIENGVLKKYTGSDEVVVFPYGVKRIESYVFSRNGWKVNELSFERA